MKIFRTSTLLALAGALALAVVPSSALAAGTTLSETITTTPHLERVFKWTIDKSVTPAHWDLFRGDSGTSQYTVAVTKDAGTQRARFDGQVCITNGGAVATQGLTSTLELRDGIPPPNDLIATFPLDVSAKPVLAAGETFCYPYSITVPPGFEHPGGPYKITANTTITNHAPDATTKGPNETASTTLPTGETPVNDSITVGDDVQGPLGTFTATGSTTYTHKFACDADAGTNDNTATISPASASANASDSASVTVACHALDVSKTAATSLTRTYAWTIAKTADPTAKTIATGDSFSASYSVKVNATGTDSDHAAKGTITVHNPAPIPATINSVSDVASGVATAASVDCGTASFPFVLSAGATLSCTYTLALPNAATRTNTATATLQNESFSAAGLGTASGTTGFSGTASIDFASATITRVDTSVDVTDPAAPGGTVGTASVFTDTLPKTFPAYTQTIGPYSTCGDKTETNTATFTTNDTATKGTDTATVTAHVECRLTVTKNLVPATDAGRFNLLIDTAVKAANVGDGGTTGPQQVTMGSHTVSETAGTSTTLSEYVTAIGGACAANGTVSFASGDSDKTCTITNTKKGRVTVKKTTDGVVNSTRSINFTLTGPGLAAGGVTLNTFGDTDGVLDFGYALVPGSQYTVCENPVPAGFTSFWKLDGTIVTPYNPNATNSPPQDLGVRCFNFSATAGQTRAFDVDNSHPGGEPRTIGFWKNWNKCTGGNQAATAAKNGGAAAGVFIVEDLLPQTVGNFTATTCLQAVRVLSKQDQAGANHANDGAYELASQMMAARFNLAAGAETCTAVQNAMVSAQQLLVSINFTGSGDYLTKASANRTSALTLAGTLANYNMGTLC